LIVASTAKSTTYFEDEPGFVRGLLGGYFRT